MRRRRSGWYAKTLLSYLLLAGVLLTCVGVLVVQEIRTMVEIEIQESTESALDSVCAAFEDWCQTMDKYVMQIKGDVRMSPYTLANDGYAVWRAIREMYKTVVYDNVCDTIALVYAPHYFSAQPRVYTSSNSFEAQNFFSSQYRYDQWDVRDIYADMAGIVVPQLRAAEWVTVGRTERRRYLTYIVPMSASMAANERGLMLFMVPEDNFLKMLSSVNIPKEATLAMADAAGNVVLSGGDTALAEGFALPDAARCEIDGEPCRLFQSAVKGGQWRFALLMPEWAATDAVQTRLWNILAILGAGMAIAVGGSLVLSVMMFRPVRRLTGIARSFETEPSGKGGEFEQIELAMTGLSRANMDLLSRLNSQRGSLRQHMLQAMCSGLMDQKDAFLALVREDGIFFDEASLRMIVLRIDNEEQLERRMDNSLRALTRYGLLQILHETAKEYQIGSIGGETGMDNRIVVLLSGSVDDEGNLRAALEQLEQLAMEHFGFSLTIGASEAFGGLERISAECRRAMDASEMRFIEGCGRIFVASRRSSGAALDEKARRQLMRIEMRLTGLLREEKYRESIAALDQYVQAARDLKLSPNEARRQLMVLRSSIYQQLSMLGADTRAMDWLTNRTYETMDSLRDAIAAALRELENSRASAQEMQRSELVDRCVDYMHANLSDLTLTMDGLADALEVSAGYLSRCFKAQMGITPWQYFDGLRLRRACQLLSDTDLRIGDILLACGYVDRTNFMRKFKRQYGMTPMEYRRASSSAPEALDDLPGEDDEE